MAFHGPMAFDGPNGKNISELIRSMKEDNVRKAIPSPNEVYIPASARPVFLPNHPTPATRVKIYAKDHIDTLLEMADRHEKAKLEKLFLDAGQDKGLADRAVANFPPTTTIYMDREPVRDNPIPLAMRALYLTGVAVETADTRDASLTLIPLVMRALYVSIRSRAEEFVGPYYDIKEAELAQILAYFRSPAVEEGTQGTGLSADQIALSSQTLNQFTIATEARKAHITAELAAGRPNPGYQDFRDIPAEIVALLKTTYNFNHQLFIPDARMRDDSVVLEAELQSAKPAAIARAIRRGGPDALLLLKMLAKDLALPAGDPAVADAKRTIILPTLVTMLKSSVTKRALKRALATRADKSAVRAVKKAADSLADSLVGRPERAEAIAVRNALVLIVEPETVIGECSFIWLEEVRRLAMAVAAAVPDAPPDIRAEGVESAAEIREYMLMDHYSSPLVGILHELASPISVPVANVIKTQLVTALATAHGEKVAARLVTIICSEVVPSITVASAHWFIKKLNETLVSIDENVVSLNNQSTALINLAWMANSFRKPGLSVDIRALPRIRHIVTCSDLKDLQASLGLDLELDYDKVLFNPFEDFRDESVIGKNRHVAPVTDQDITWMYKHTAARKANKKADVHAETVPRPAPAAS